MDKKTYERLQYYNRVKGQSKMNIKLCDNQIQGIYDICDHKYPDGTDALEYEYYQNMYFYEKCKICDYKSHWQEIELVKP